MHIPFQNLSSTSRLWVYASDRALTKSEQESASVQLAEFVERWMVHGKPMHASFDIRNDHFVILAADENASAASGCSIDDSVRTIRALGEHLSVNFFNRNNVLLLNDDAVEVHSLPTLKKQLEGNQLHGNTLMFDTLITTKSDLESRWLVPISSSWLKRYLPQESVSH